MNKTIVCHLTSVHKRNDVRIFEKQCKSLANEGFEVSLIVADGLGDDIIDNIKIFDIGKSNSRLQRFFITTKKVYKKALSINADIYHFHDPELIPTGLKLLRMGKKVIYDIHEDVPQQILSKPYLNNFSKKFISKIFLKYENHKAGKFSALSCATPHIRDRFDEINKNAIDINNFPLIEEFANISTPWEQRKDEICYIGSISVVRGIREIVNALEYCNFKLHLAGDFVSSELETEIKSLKGWQNVIYHGFIDRNGIVKLLSTVKLGLVTLHPTNAYKMAYPVKMFEYMAAGVPVLASNFELYKQIIDDAHCGDVADPLNPQEIAEKIKQLFENQQNLMQMGLNGSEAVQEKYNWQIEKIKLIYLYKRLSKN